MFYTGTGKLTDTKRSLGLGLALCKSVIEAHHGELILEDNQPHGQNLPLVCRKVRRKQKMKILVIEDDTTVRHLIVTTLDTHGYEYLSAKNAEEGLDLASQEEPDVILLDLGLPDLDGIEVIKKIRSWSNMPIIVISARSEDADKIEALDAGADDYLTKPFSVDELLARLRVIQRRLAYLNEHSPQEEISFTNGDLHIDYGAASVT